jgi:serine/threonine-protein kinase RsbW
MTGPAEVHLSIRSEARNVTLAAKLIRVFCEFAALPALAAVEVELALVEAANNAILHGSRTTDAKITMHARIEADALVIELHDSGEPLANLPGRDMPPPLEESGRGWPLIHALMDRIDYCSDGGVNVLTLTKSLAGAQGE